MIYLWSDTDQDQYVSIDSNFELKYDTLRLLITTSVSSNFSVIKWRSSSRYGERFQLWLKCDTWYSWTVSDINCRHNISIILIIGNQNIHNWQSSLIRIMLQRCLWENKTVTCNLLNHPIYVISFAMSVLWLQWFNDRGMILGIPYNIYINHFTYDNHNCTCTWPSLIYLCF